MPKQNKRVEWLHCLTVVIYSNKHWNRCFSSVLTGCVNFNPLRYDSSLILTSDMLEIGAAIFGMMTTSSLILSPVCVTSCLVAFSRLRISLFLSPNAEILRIMDPCDLMSRFCASYSVKNVFWTPQYTCS